MGDLHGDYEAWQTIARSAGLIDGAGHWAAGKTILVQMGDITDRWADSLKIVRSLQQLSRSSRRSATQLLRLCEGPLVYLVTDGANGKTIAAAQKRGLVALCVAWA